MNQIEIGIICVLLAAGFFCIGVLWQMRKTFAAEKELAVLRVRHAQLQETYNQTEEGKTVIMTSAEMRLDLEQALANYPASVQGEPYHTRGVRGFVGTKEG